MKLLILTLLNLLFAVYWVNGQGNKADSENLHEKYRIYVRPELKDSLTRGLDLLPHRIDSLKIYPYFSKKPLPGNPYLHRPHFNKDNMAFNPGPSFDRMPNAKLTIPGVHYMLKIVPPAGNHTKMFRIYPQNFRH
jgi:hypothetical protein